MQDQGNPSEMSRDDILARLRALRAALAAVDGREVTEKTPAPVEEIPEDRLQQYLSDLARLGARYGFELEPDIRHGSMRLKPITADHGGYLATHLDQGFPVLESYRSGEAHTDQTGVIVGDDFHPDARAERARLWREENAEAIAEHAKHGLSWMPTSQDPRADTDD